MRKTLKSIIYLGISILICTLVTMNVEQRGKKYEKNFVLDDIGFRLLPKIQGCTFWFENTLPFLLGGILFMNKLLDHSTITMIAVMILFRSVAIGLTVFPKTNPACCVGCDWRIGACHDKMYSGHTAITTLSMLVLASKFPQITPLVPLVIATQGCMLVMTRGHYTIDIYIGFLVALLIFTNKHHLNKII